MYPSSIGVEIDIKDAQNFLKIKETLTRIGMTSKESQKLFQSCHILHKRQKYFIVHFKEMFVLDGKTTNIDADDYGRRNAIVALLEEWNLISVLNKPEFISDRKYLSSLKVIPFKEKGQWELISKYNIGKKS